MGTRLREVESGFRYTPTICLETLPSPDVAPDQRARVGEAARHLIEFRDGWLNPPGQSETGRPEAETGLCPRPACPC